jgi:hypothetical protein
MPNGWGISRRCVLSRTSFFPFALSPAETLFGRASEEPFDELRANGREKANASEQGTELRFVPWRYWMALHFNAGTLSSFNAIHALLRIR